MVNLSQGGGPIGRLTGETKWSFYTRFSKNGIHGSPTINPERNLVYIGAYDGWLYAVNRETGKHVWNSRLGDYIVSSPTLYNGVVYIGVEMRAPDGYLVGVDADNGRELFRSDKLGNHPHSTPTINPESGCIFLGENNATCTVTDLETRVSAGASRLKLTSSQPPPSLMA